MVDALSDIGSAANRYEVLAKLASGGMAEIFLARTKSSAGVERYVVLKRVHKHRATDIKFVHMFLDEARLAAQLQHPNIAQVFDTGKFGDTYFFTMEYVHGETVRELLHRSYEQGQPIPLGCVLTIIAGAAAALQHAHDRLAHDGTPLGIVHRDVSPSNLMVSFEGHVKIVDFGVAKAAHRSVETQSGTVKGKMGYMAPEQCRGGEVDRRCDLFSLGIVFWEMLVGQRLFKRATDFESMEAIIEEPTPPPSSVRPEIPPAIDAIVLKLLEKSPSARYQSADDLLEALEAAATSTALGLSVAMVRRYIRELFGNPAEPWVELRRGAQREEAVTVTGAPVNGRLELAGDELERLRDLSSSRGESMPIHIPSAAVVAAREADRRADLGERAVSTDEIPRPGRQRRTGLWLAILLGAAGTVAAAGYVLGTRTNQGAPQDAAQAAIVVDAAVAQAPIDAVVVVASPPDVGDPAPPIDAGSSSEIVPEPKPRTIKELVGEKRFADAVTACDAATRLGDPDAVACTLAACREHDSSAARKFLAQVRRAKQRLVISQCAKIGLSIAAGTPRVTPPHVDPPQVDPAKDPTGKGSNANTGTNPGSGTKPECTDPDPMACRR
ncbi:MAG: serine/threonine protein kinase [Myxococcales bacterium]|nr:serine/threonine protein kinase [Myxococcales bacterium]